MINDSIPLSDDIVYALEDGHLNTSFSDGSNGYCIEYREQEAVVGDKFYCVDTSYYDSSVYLKTYFLRYYTHTQKDNIVTQHMIWHFTDGFDGWRLNYTIIDDVKSNPLNVPDDGVYRINSTHSLKYSFNVLLSPYVEHQDYFTYIICLIENTIMDDGLDNSNITDNESIVFVDNILINESIRNNGFHIDEIILNNGDGGGCNVNKNSINLNEVVTGYNIKILTVILMILIVTLLILNDYRKKRR